MVGKIMFAVPAQIRDRLAFVDRHQFAAHPHLVKPLPVAVGMSVRAPLDRTIR